MKLSIIIVSYNVRYFLEQCLLSVNEATTLIESEIIVIDNHSDDDSCEMIKEKFPNVILVENKTNLGFAKANNAGASIATSEYICFLNPDTVVSQDIFNYLIDQADRLPNSGLVGPRLINGAGNYLHESKRNIPSPLTSLRRLFGIKLGKVKNYYANRIPVSSIGDVDVLVGAFMLMKKKNYYSVGEFDDDYFIYGEDLDLSYRFKKNGFQNYYIGTQVALHYKGESIDPSATFIKHFYGAMRLFYKKHFKSNIILDRLISFAIRIVSFIQSFKKFDTKKKVINHYYLISEDMILHTKLSGVLKRKIIIFKTLKKEDLGDSNIEIIFDNNFVNFDQIIDWMQELRKENVTFKIRPKDRHFILGSNFSDGKGEIIVF